MEDQDYRVMNEANNAHLAAYLLHFLVRARERDAAPEAGETRLLEQLRRELMTSWMGAREIAVDAFAPSRFENGLPEDTPFGQQLDEYGRFRQFHGSNDPSAHGEWVEGIVEQINLLEHSRWSTLKPEQRSNIREGLERLLRWMSSSHGAGLPQRQPPVIPA